MIERAGFFRDRTAAEWAEAAINDGGLCLAAAILGGVQAHKEGLARDANPFPEHSARARHWAQGWCGQDLGPSPEGRAEGERRRALGRRGRQRQRTEGRGQGSGEGAPPARLPYVDD